MGIVFIIFAELRVLFFQICAELWVPKLYQNGTSPSNIRVSYPPGYRARKLLARYVSGMASEPHHIPHTRTFDLIPHTRTLDLIRHTRTFDLIPHTQTFDLIPHTRTFALPLNFRKLLLFVDCLFIRHLITSSFILLASF